MDQSSSSQSAENHNKRGPLGGETSFATRVLHVCLVCVFVRCLFVSCLFVIHVFVCSFILSLRLFLLWIVSCVTVVVADTRELYIFPSNSPKRF